MWVTFAIIGGAIVLYATERFSVEVVSAAVIAAFLIFFEVFPLAAGQGHAQIDASDILSGFSSTALFAVMSLLIVGQAMFQTGALEGPTGRLLSIYSRRPAATVAMAFAAVFTASAFLNDTPVVVMFIPIMAALAQRAEQPASRYMMPLGFICILGGMTTIIGTSTNLLVVETYRAATGDQIGFFDITPIGLALGLAGVLYIAVFSSRILPQRLPQADEIPADTASSGRQFIAQIEVTDEHPLIGRGAVAGLFPDLPDVTVRMVQRREKVFLPPFEDFEFHAGDIIIVAATRQTLTSLLKTRPEMLSGILSGAVESGETTAQNAGQLVLAEAVVTPGSRMIGRSIQQIGFHYNTNCILLAVQRRTRMIRMQLNSVRIEAGDVLLLLGSVRDIRGLRTNRDVLVLEWSMTDLPVAKNVNVARGIFAGVIVTAATGILPIFISALVGAIAMVATGCLNIRQASRAFDRRIFLLIGAALAMGTAMERTGGAAFVAQHIINLAEPFGPWVLLSALFALVAITTNIITNNAAAVLFTPIALELGRLTNMDPIPFVYTVIFAANCSFATPVSYQVNLLVMGPGHYRFRDYAYLGGPLVVVLWAVYSLVAPLFYSMTGLI